ncbi:hypothetical protein QV15_13550 [Staphylococcus aureus]|nr:hypothetical protein KQ76_13730 [Staphylococcus aureus]OFL39058.1 hypothetical protein HMPREF2770_11800 [Staphylococcus sp. HMSC075C08]OHP06600.1 hypothetical protein HMPREF2671_10510 [Staphylococcus sp. HMSC058E01]OHQ05402.1 hypothetical protein HMPREF2733_00340 [Staphylococcus sp. HMSC063H12]OHS79005.1 hypothetical protein HMPREF3285_08570 [Staphylococcus sp. HMSC74F04]
MPFIIFNHIIFHIDISIHIFLIVYLDIIICYWKIYEINLTHLFQYPNDTMYDF